MTIRIELSPQSINEAIRRLEMYKEDLEIGIRDIVEILANEGAGIAQAAYGNWGVQAVPSTEQGSSGMSATGFIDVAGDMPLIAEFGAGDDTLDPATLFEHSPDTEVFPGSYSLLEGSQEYYRSGVWHYGGQAYTEVFPRQGLHMAKEYIIQNSTEIAREVFSHD